MRPLSRMDAVVGLISKDFVFSPFKLRLEKRLLDAWADGQLLQVKLDHAFAPVGLRDLPAIDASFEAQRDPFAWMKVAAELENLRLLARTRETLDRNQSDGSTSLGMGLPPEQRLEPAPSPMAPAPAGAAPQPPEEWSQHQTNSYRGASYDRAGAPMAHKHAAKRGGGFGLILLLLLLIGGGVTGYLALFSAQAPLSTPAPPGPGDQPAYPTPPPDYTPPVEFAGFHFSQPILMATAIVVGLVFMAVIAIGASRKAKLERKMGKPAKGAKTEREASANAPSYSVAPPLTEQAPEPLVFISYARADQTSVDPLAKAVKASGHPIWIDTDEINAGTSWAGEIVRAIKSAGHVLIMCSPRSFESDQVKREVYLADRYKKPLMPVFLEAAEPPEDFEYFFAGVQWLKLHEAPEADRPAILTRALPTA